mmetsp:Transcript_7377/g.13270  ORF Transcript_7377/g.13270 Transcript_7377/m.13270 type:complete len:223 (+) Transcript_7377:1306-1974(+)
MMMMTMHGEKAAPAAHLRHQLTSTPTTMDTGCTFPRFPAAAPPAPPAARLESPAAARAARADTLADRPPLRQRLAMTAGLRPSRGTADGAVLREDMATGTADGISLLMTTMTPALPLRLVRAVSLAMERAASPATRAAAAHQVPTMTAVHPDGALLPAGTAVGQVSPNGPRPRPRPPPRLQAIPLASLVSPVAERVTRAATPTARLTPLRPNQAPISDTMIG